jgi:hypothetical protein
LAIKTSSQVGFVSRRGMKVIAQRASKAQYVIWVAHLKLQKIGDDRIDGDLITKHTKKIC